MEKRRLSGFPLHRRPDRNSTLVLYTDDSACQNGSFHFGLSTCLGLTIFFFGQSIAVRGRCRSLTTKFFHRLAVSDVKTHQIQRITETLVKKTSIKALVQFGTQRSYSPTKNTTIVFFQHRIELDTLSLVSQYIDYKKTGDLLTLPLLLYLIYILNIFA